ncbi:MAG: methionyl-tRNA formyltransferase [Alphaproteobacteria bacterium]
MKIVFLGYDYTLNIAQQILDDGHNLTQIFTFPCDNVFAFNTETHGFAQTHNIPISEKAITPEDVNSLIVQECSLFICAGYPHKIPVIPSEKAYGINLHPSLLPRARGVMPLPYIIMEDPSAAGFSVHKLEESFDAGDILYQEAIQINPHTDVETLSAKIAIKSPNAISQIISNLKEYWNSATPQDSDNASYYHAPSDKMRSLDFEQRVEKILKKGLAFGRFGVRASLKHNQNTIENLAVFNLSGWIEPHNHATGTVLRHSPREIIVTAKNGYICLKEFSNI